MLIDSIEVNQALEKNGEFLHKNLINGDVLYARRFDKKGKSRYNEYQTNAMIWAHSSATKPGDTKILNTNGRHFALIEATKDGFVELKKRKL